MKCGSKNNFATNNSISEKLYHYPHSHMNKLIEKMVLFLDAFSTDIIKFNSFTDCEQYRRTHAHWVPKIPIDLPRTTLIIDAKDFLVQKLCGEKKHGDLGFWSDKLKNLSKHATYVLLYKYTKSHSLFNIRFSSNHI